MAVSLADAPVIDRITLGNATLATQITLPSNSHGMAMIQPIASAVRLAFSGTDGQAITDNYVTIFAGEKFDLTANIGTASRDIYVGGDTANAVVVEVMVEQTHAAGREL